MSFSIDDLKHIANLARLTLTQSEIKKYRREISGIVSYVNKLAQANVTKEEATTNLSENNNLLRVDVVEDCQLEEKIIALGNAPRKNKKYIAVPRILES